jgi:hypothetical protein
MVVILVLLITQGLNSQWFFVQVASQMRMSMSSHQVMRSSSTEAPGSQVSLGLHYIGSRDYHISFW